MVGHGSVDRQETCDLKPALYTITAVFYAAQHKQCIRSEIHLPRMSRNDAAVPLAGCCSSQC